MSMDDALEILHQSVGPNTSAAEMRRWRIAFIMGFATGFLIERDPDSVDASSTADVSEAQVRVVTRQKLAKFITQNPHLSALDILRQGMATVHEEYKTAAAGEPGLNPTLELTHNLLHWVHVQPEVDERFATEALQRADIPVSLGT